MITNFKLFEKYNFSKELIDYLDDNYIEEYFDDKYDIDIEEIAGMWPQILYNHVNDERFIDDWIRDEINNRSIDDYDENDFREYLDENWSEDIEKDIVKKWCDDNDIEQKIISDYDGVIKIKDDDESNRKVIIKTPNGEKVKYKIPEEHTILYNNGDKIRKGKVISKVEYDEDMYKDMDEDYIRELMDRYCDEEDFVETKVKDNYDNYDAQTLIEDIYGKLEGKQLYDILQWYIDEDAIKDEWKENEDWNYKKEFVADYISNDRELQLKILERSENEAIVELFQFLANEHSKNNIIADEYEYQKLYIEKYLEENGDTDDEDDKNEYWPEALKFLHKNFGLDPDIKEEYGDYTYLIDAEKYNL